MRIGGFGGAVVPGFHVVPLQIDGDRRRVVEFNCLVVAVAFYVFRNEELLAEAGAFTIQDFNFQKRVAQAVAFHAENSTQLTAHLKRRFIKPTQSTASPNLVRAHSESGKVVLRESYRIQDDLRLIGDDENVLRIHCFRRVTKRYHRVFHPQTSQSGRGARSVSHVSTIACRWIAGLPNNLNRIECERITALTLNALYGLSDRKGRSHQRCIMRNAEYL